MATVNWLHLSDWHQGGGDFDRKVVAQALEDDIKRRAEFDPLLERIDFVFFTGDLAFSGKKAEYEAARDLLLEPIRKAVGLEVDRLFLIPGNHDLDRSVFRRLPAEVQQPFTSQQQANEWLTDDELRSDLLKPFNAYQKFVTEYSVPDLHFKENWRMMPVGDTKVGIFGVNSALMCGREDPVTKQNDDKNKLTVGEPQVHDALRAIKNAPVRIGLIHHPFDWLTEADENIVEARMYEGCDFILRGHVHKPRVVVTKGTMGDCVIIPGGACFDKRVPYRMEYINAYNFVSFDTETRQGTVTLRRWNLDNTGWTADTDRSKDGKYHFGERPLVKTSVSNSVQPKKSPDSVPTLFISYAHTDKKWRDELLLHLKPMLRNETMVEWNDTQIPAGTQWSDEIEAALNDADAGVLLVTPAFLASDFIFKRELPVLLRKKVLWVPISASSFEETTLAAYQALHNTARPLTSLPKPKRDAAWVDICRRIKEALSHP